VNLEHRGLEPSVNRLCVGMLTSALFLGSSLLLGLQFPPCLAGISVAGALGVGASLVLGLRLLRAIKVSGGWTAAATARNAEALGSSGNSSRASVSPVLRGLSKLRGPGEVWRQAWLLCRAGGSGLP